MIPVVDIFAGPGGLSEGFSSFRVKEQHPFSVRLSVESKSDPYFTLRLRSFFRQFPQGNVPADYYSFLSGEIDEHTLFTLWPEQAIRANTETWQAVLGDCDHWELDEKIHQAIGGSDKWLLIGGPPCQAYSCAGVVGNRTRKNYNPEYDTRFRLYREFIRVLAIHKPFAFVFENVPGILSAKLGDKKIIDNVLLGLAKPGDFLHREFGGWPDTCLYRLVSLTSGIQGLGCDPRLFTVQAESLGLPQARHRVIIIGIRMDGDPSRFISRSPKPVADLDSVIGDLPPVRSVLSREQDSLANWREVFFNLKDELWASEVKAKHGHELYDLIIHSSRSIQIDSPEGSGRDFLKCIPPEPLRYSEWYSDRRLHGVNHHEARSHIRSDLHRYLFCACFGKLYGKSPTLPDFPFSLLPRHRNHDSGSFKDRFRVLLSDRPSGTIISHLAKDGHAFIHPDPKQCRSLTPREAARIQTFPDNYYFFGFRTSKFHQIGNAVPPLLAHQIAEALHPVFI